MARYTVNFSTNAAKILKDIEKVNKAIAKATVVGKDVQIKFNTSTLTRQIDDTFNRLDNKIAKMQAKLAKTEIGSRKFDQLATGIGIAEGRREQGGMRARAIQLSTAAGQFDAGSLQNLRRELEALQIEASQLTPNTAAWRDFQEQIGTINRQLQESDRLAESIQMQKNLGAFAPGSLNQLEGKLTILRNRAREISPNTTEWKKLNREIRQTERSIKKLSSPMSRGQRLGAAGGAFLYGGGMGGGVGSAVGGIAGGLMGGPAGAFAGAAIGQVADNLIGGAGELAKQAATIQQLRKGLALASVDAKDFAEAQTAITESSKNLQLPQESIMRQFTQLRVNTKQYGMSVKETQKVLEGVVLAVSSVGGSADDVDGAMRAVVQIFSKGSVQAEELRGQLGERFPGAVVKFAAANKMSMSELQDAFKKGQVTVADFVKFAEQNYEDYAEFSKQLATAPEFAGRRLEKAFNDISIAIGDLLLPMGSTFQDVLTGMLTDATNWVNENKVWIKQYIKDIGTIYSAVAKVAGGIIKVFLGMYTRVAKIFAGILKLIRKVFGAATVAEIQADIANETQKLSRVTDAKAKKRIQQRIDDLKKQYKAKGGDAALAAEQGDFTFGGEGAGVDPSAVTGGTGGGGGKAKTYRLNNVIAVEQELGRQLLRIKLSSLSAREKELAAARATFRAADRIATLNHAKELAKIEESESTNKAVGIENANRQLRKAQSDAANEYLLTVAGPLVDAIENEREAIANTRLEIDQAKQGRNAQNAVLESEALIRKVLAGANVTETETLKGLIAELRKLALIREKANKELNAAKVKERIQNLRDEIEVLRTINKEEARRLEIQKELNVGEEEAGEIYKLEKVRDNIKETREIIDDFVTSTSSDYKGFLKKVISGEDSAEALKEFQKSLQDKVVTIFLDFSMKPVEEFFQEAMGGLFKDFLGGEEAAKAKPQEDNTSALQQNTTAIQTLTSAIQGNLTPGTGMSGTGLTTGESDVDGAVAKFDTGIQSVTDSIGEAGEKADTEKGEQGKKWKEGLSKSVQAIGLAAGTVMGIAAGMNQIKEGGTANVLGGIGSILMSVGGGIGGFMNLFGGKAAANGAVWKGGFQAFADGGVVNGPTLGLVGEGKYNEAIVPLPNGKSIPVQMKGESLKDKMNASQGQAGPPMLSMKFETTKIGNVEYVSKDQLEQAMMMTQSLAAKQGATKGASMAIDKLIQSPSTRKKVGLG